jgi:hypothetical protein
MYGLPLQGLNDLQRTLPWASRIRGVNVQCLQTLLLPGTELRARRRTWRLAAGVLPPYPVTSTSTLTASDFRTIENMIAAHPRLRSDISTTRFVGRKLPDLFDETLTVEAAELGRLINAPGTRNRRALLIGGKDLFGHRQDLAAFLSRAVKAEPDSLFQFVLAPEREEPLDLVDLLIATLRRCPPHLLDRYASAVIRNQMAARRVMISLPSGRRFDPAWIQEAESLLAGAFF